MSSPMEVEMDYNRTLMQNLSSLCKTKDHYVKKLMNYTQSGDDLTLAERAVETLVKKLRKKRGAIDKFVKAVRRPERPSKCVTVGRSADGQVQVLKQPMDCALDNGNVLTMATIHPPPIESSPERRNQLQTSTLLTPESNSLSGQNSEFQKSINFTPPSSNSEEVYTLQISSLITPPSNNSEYKNRSCKSTLNHEQLDQRNISQTILNTPSDSSPEQINMPQPLDIVPLDIEQCLQALSTPLPDTLFDIIDGLLESTNAQPSPDEVNLPNSSKIIEGQKPRTSCTPPSNSPPLHQPDRLVTSPSFPYQDIISLIEDFNNNDNSKKQLIDDEFIKNLSIDEQFVNNQYIDVYQQDINYQLINSQYSIETHQHQNVNNQQDIYVQVENQKNIDMEAINQQISHGQINQNQNIIQQQMNNQHINQQKINNLQAIDQQYVDQHMNQKQINNNGQINNQNINQQQINNLQINKQHINQQQINNLQINNQHVNQQQINNLQIRNQQIIDQQVINLRTKEQQEIEKKIKLDIIMNGIMTSPQVQNQQNNESGPTPVSYVEQAQWITIGYYEQNTRVGASFRGSQNVVTVDGCADPNENDRLCLGNINNPCRTVSSEKARQGIGQGIKLHNVNGAVFLEVNCENAVFVQAMCCNKQRKLNQDTVIRMTVGTSLKIFDAKFFSCMLEEAVNKNSFKDVYKLVNMCIVRLSFINGWGAKYQRRDATETPCWLEIHLNGPLQWLDAVLVTMGSPLETIDSVS